MTRRKLGPAIQVGKEHCALRLAGSVSGRDVE